MTFVPGVAVKELGPNAKPLISTVLPLAPPEPPEAVVVVIDRGMLVGVVTPAQLVSYATAA